MEKARFEGLVAAAITPLALDGSLKLETVGDLTDYLVGNRISGLYVCGSTGEGLSLTDEERRAVAEAYINAARGRAKVLVQVGHNSLATSRSLAEHAHDAGADAISATCPAFFKIDDLGTLVDSMAHIASAVDPLPFYYYHIPMLTGATLNMTDFLRQAGDQIPNLAGIKYAAPTLHEYQACLALDGGRFDLLWAVDEMLLGALATGAKGAVGSTYNVAAPLYHRIFDAFGRGDLVEARRCQLQAVEMIGVLTSFPLYAALRQAMQWIGFDCGACRLPNPKLSAKEASELKRKLEAIGFFEWATATPTAAKPDADGVASRAPAPGVSR